VLGIKPSWKYRINMWWYILIFVNKASKFSYAFYDGIPIYEWKMHTWLKFLGRFLLSKVNILGLVIHKYTLTQI
jgi:hypothetical protein